ncbi:MAG: 3-dehydroquinate synthase [Chthoniobacterales bacterium]
MTRVEICAGAKAYEAVVGAGLLGDFRSLLPELLSDRRAAIICDPNTRRFADRFDLPRRELIELAAGEQSKSLEQVGAICERMIDAGLDRTSFVIGVGGGVVGDISGFVAAIFQRGIPHVQVPTTLLGMVDSSIGGKTGVNTRAGKNLLGAVHQPSLIVADTDTLATLPQREFRQGFAEIIKHGIIRDAEMLQELRASSLSFRPERSGVEESSGSRGFLDCARNDMEALIARNIEIKAAIVATDERDQSGERALLNFGHTVGHAIERAAGYGKLLHGEAISIGIAAACDVSVKRAGFPADERQQVVELLHLVGLPTLLPDDVSREAVFDAVRFDKKFCGGEVRFVVTPRLGEAHLSRDVTLDDIQEAIAGL